MYLLCSVLGNNKAGGLNPIAINTPVQTNDNVSAAGLLALGSNGCKVPSQTFAQWSHGIDEYRALIFTTLPNTVAGSASLVHLS